MFGLCWFWIETCLTQLVASLVTWMDSTAHRSDMNYWVGLHKILKRLACPITHHH